MYICICNGITEDQLIEVIDQNNIVCMSELQQHNICDSCSKCFNDSLKVLYNCNNSRFKNTSWYIDPLEGSHWEINLTV